MHTVADAGNLAVTFGVGDDGRLLFQATIFFRSRVLHGPWQEMPARDEPHEAIQRAQQQLLNDAWETFASEHRHAEDR